MARSYNEDFKAKMARSYNEDFKAKMDSDLAYHAATGNTGGAPHLGPLDEDFGAQDAPWYPDLDGPQDVPDTTRKSSESADTCDTNQTHLDDWSMDAAIVVEKKEGPVAAAVSVVARLAETAVGMTGMAPGWSWDSLNGFVLQTPQ